jgi:hypothetical protein
MLILMPLITNPLKIEFDRWASQLILDLSTYNIPFHQGVENWRFWANQIINLNPIINPPLPTELSYPTTDDWRQWAIRFYEVILPQ